MNHPPSSLLASSAFLAQLMQAGSGKGGKGESGGAPGWQGAKVVPHMEYLGLVLYVKYVL